MENQKVTAFILAGGKSSRMGEDKGLLMLNGKPMISYLITTLQQSFETIKIIANNNDYNQFGVEVIPDSIKNKGPLGGVFTALKSTSASYNVILSCDTPFVTKKTIESLLTHSSQVNLISHKGKVEPLIGVYHKNCLPKVEEFLTQNNLKMMSLIDALNTKIMEINSYKENEFYNFNTKEDIEKWKLS